MGENDAENAEFNYQRILLAGAMNGTAPDLQSILPEKTFIDHVNPIRLLNNDEALILGHKSRKDLSLVKVNFN